MNTPSWVISISGLWWNSLRALHGRTRGLNSSPCFLFSQIISDSTPSTSGGPSHHNNTLHHFRENLRQLEYGFRRIKIYACRINFVQRQVWRLCLEAFHKLFASLVSFLLPDVNIITVKSSGYSLIGEWSSALSNCHSSNLLAECYNPLLLFDSERLRQKCKLPPWRSLREQWWVNCEFIFLEEKGKEVSRLPH